MRILLTTFFLLQALAGFSQYNRSWGTYYGGTRRDEIKAITAFGNDAIYAAGFTQSDGAGVISTTGAHQVNRGSASTGSSGRDGMLIKFNGNGVRQWASYYGGNQEDQILAIAADANGNVYIAGKTLSGGGIATAGSHKSSTFSADAFLVKFNANGVRQWGTYYGSQFQPEEGAALAIDASGNIYLAGMATGSSEGVSTTGAHQVTVGAQTDAFVVKFNAAGVRQWGTFYGGAGNDFATGITTDAQGNVLLTGFTNSPSGIASDGSHQPALSGSNNDGFIVKFSTTGERLWGTYYGGAEVDFFNAIKTDAQSNVFVCGTTQSTAGIATEGAHQTAKGGNALDADAFLVKMDANGNRIWSTYYGAAGSDGAAALAINAAGTIAIAGGSNSATGIATSNTYQTAVGGNGLPTDGYFALFDANGVRTYGSYYGSTFDDDATAIAFLSNDQVLLAGRTLSTGSALASNDGHQTSYNGDANSSSSGFYDGFVVKFGAATTATQFTFTGNGNWSNAANWQGGMVPPTIIPSGVTIIIAPDAANECVVDVPVTFSAGSSLQVPAGKKLRIIGSLTIAQ